MTDKPTTSREPELSTEMTGKNMDTSTDNTENTAAQNQPPRKPAELKPSTEISEEKLKAVMGFLKESTAPLCSQHKGKEVSIYCKTCERQICTSCVVAGDHSNHKFCEIDDVVPAKKRNLNDRIAQSRNEMIEKLQKNVELIKKEKGNVTKNCEDMLLKIESRKTAVSEMLEACSRNQQSKVKAQKQKTVQRLDEDLKEPEMCLAILEHFERNSNFGDYIDGNKCGHVLEMLTKATKEEPMDVSDELAFTTNMAAAEGMEKWFGHVTGVNSYDSHNQAAKIQFCDSQITQISPINAKKAFVVTEDHLYLVDSTQVKYTRADIKPLMTNVEYITPVTERGIYVQQTNRAVIKRVTTDGQKHRFTKFDSSHSLSLSHTGMVMAWSYSEESRYSYDRNLKVNFFNGDGVKLNQHIDIYLQGDVTDIVHTANNKICILRTKELPSELYEPDCVLTFDSSVKRGSPGITKYSGVLGSEPETTFKPMGLCKDPDGCLIVSDYWNHAVHQLTSDGQFKKFLMTESDGLMYPTAVGIDNINWLWVAQRDGHIHIVKYKS